MVMEATHLCMLMRGVEKQNSKAVTSAMLGAFRDRPETRSEFMELIKGRSAAHLRLRRPGRARHRGEPRHRPGGRARLRPGGRRGRPRWRAGAASSSRWPGRSRRRAAGARRAGRRRRGGHGAAARSRPPSREFGRLDCLVTAQGAGAFGPLEASRDRGLGRDAARQPDRDLSPVPGRAPADAGGGPGDHRRHGVAGRDAGDPRAARRTRRPRRASSGWCARWPPRSRPRRAGRRAVPGGRGHAVLGRDPEPPGPRAGCSGPRPSPRPPS